jgi:hypothetical protein
MTVHNDIAAAKAKVREAWDLWRILGGKIDQMNAMVASRRLYPDELTQLAYRMRAVEIARDRALDDARGWRRIVDRLEGQNPGQRGSISLRPSSVAPSRPVGPIRLSGRGAISLR